MIPTPDLSEYVKPVDMQISAFGGYGDVWMGRLEIGSEISTVSGFPVYQVYQRHMSNIFIQVAVKHLRCPPNSSVAYRYRMDLVSVWFAPIFCVLLISRIA